MRVSGLIWSGVALLALGLAALDLNAWISPDRIRGGESFLYWSNVDLVRRLPLALLVPAAGGAYLFLRRSLRPVQHIPLLAFLIMLLALFMVSFVTPALRIGRPAVHIQTAAVDGQLWHLYYQTAPLPDQACDYVLVRCEMGGLQCTWQGQWRNSPICLGEQANIRLLSRDPSVVRLVVDGEQVYPVIDK